MQYGRTYSRSMSEAERCLVLSRPYAGDFRNYNRHAVIAAALLTSDDYRNRLFRFGLKLLSVSREQL